MFSSGHIFQLPTKLREIRQHPGIKDGIRVYIKRDDLIHPEISGNKWRKLKYNMRKASELGATTIVTAGGYWSNHLAAVAAAGKALGFSTTGIVRGEEPAAWSDTLTFCKENGMELVFIPRQIFDRLPGSLEEVFPLSAQMYYIPVGGDNEEGRKGCREIVEEINMDYDYLAVPVGTGTTFSGMVAAAPGKILMGFPAVKDEALHIRISHPPGAIIVPGYDFGGFARSSAALENFIVEFFLHTEIMLEPVYTGKMMYGIYDLLSRSYFPAGSTLVCIHTGGLQGLAGFPDLHRRLFTS